MTPHSTRVLARLLTASSIALIVVTASAQQPPAPTPAAAAPPAFEVVTIKPTSRTDPGWTLQPTPDGYRGENISLRRLVQEAYGVFDDNLLTGGPPWVDTAKFDLEAKFDPADIPNVKALTFRQRADMLRAVLADRFQLKVHFATKDFPVYNLVVAKGGPKFQETKPEDLLQGPSGPVCQLQKSRPGIVQRHGCPVGSLDDLLGHNAGRAVFDKTNLTGKYDLELHWTPENTPADSPLADGPSIFTALQEQLGLKLEPASAPLQVLVIDSAEHPSAN